MLNRTRQVMQNRNKVQRALAARRKNEMLDLRTRSVFKSKLYDELKHIEIILEDENVDAVRITVPDKFLAQFGTAIYSEDLASYDVEQVSGETNKFDIRRKFVAF